MGSQLFKEIGRDLAQALQNGREFSQTIATYPFFKKELSLIIEYGEVKSKLGSELEIYAEKTWETFFTRVNRTMNLVQPLVFIFVALIIVFTLCGNAYAHVSKYGGKFLKWKKLMTNLKKAKVKAFTLVEMLVVLLIISVLLLLFVPNLTKQKGCRRW